MDPPQHPIRLLVCLNVSGSLAQRAPDLSTTVLEAVKTAIVAALAALPKTSEAGLVTFDKLSSICFVPQPIVPELAGRIKPIRAGCGSNLEVALHTLLTLHNGHPTKLPTTCLILSDGAWTGGICNGKGLAEAINAIKLWKSVNYRVVAMGTEHTATLQEFARHLGGKYTHAATDRVVDVLVGLAHQAATATPSSITMTANYAAEDHRDHNASTLPLSGPTWERIRARDMGRQGAGRHVGEYRWDFSNALMEGIKLIYPG